MANTYRRQKKEQKSHNTYENDNLSGLYANGKKIDREKIINTFNKKPPYSDSSDDMPDYFGNINDLLVDGDGNRVIVQKQYNSDSDLESGNFDDNDTNSSKSIHNKPNKINNMDHTEETKYPTREKKERFIGRAKFEKVNVELENNKTPIYCEVILKNDEIPDFSNKDANYVLRENIDYPQFSLGFTHWIHASKNKTEVFNTFSNKKRVYQVVNGYERYVDEYDLSIGSVSKSYFRSGSRPGILSRAFYKLWEILYYFDLIDIESKNFVSAHLAEGPGSFIQGAMFFRDMFAKDPKNDKYYAVTLYQNKITSLNIEKQFVEYYSKEKPQRFFMHETVDYDKAKESKTKDNGDLTKSKTIENFRKDVGGNKADLITADGGFEWGNENIQEQECAFLIYGQMLAAFNVQKKGGSFVLKLFETYTSLSMKFILLLKYFYDYVHIIKPLTSRDSNSEKYAVCIGFKYSENELLNILPKLMKIQNEIDQINSKRDKPMFLCDIFSEVKIPDNLRLNMLTVNTDIANMQYKVINKMIEYINESNFHGELYMKYRARQIELSAFWIDTFMSSDKNLATGKDKSKKMFEESKKHWLSEYDKFIKTLIGYDVSKPKPNDNIKTPTNLAMSRSRSKQHKN